MNKFKTIISNLKKEYQKDWNKDSAMCDTERKLINRFEDELEQKEIIYLINDFLVPFTNNRAGADLRPIKIKQKLGKPRTFEGAENYTKIRSCISTYKKTRHKCSY